MLRELRRRPAQAAGAVKARRSMAHWLAQNDCDTFAFGAAGMAPVIRFDHSTEQHGVVGMQLLADHFQAEVI
jgi:hypothetical protein